MRWHIMPVAVVDFDKEGRTRHEDNFADDLSDCDPGGPCY
jgi:hypothetical protein